MVTLIWFATVRGTGVAYEEVWILYTRAHAPKTLQRLECHPRCRQCGLPGNTNENRDGSTCVQR
jgi:hypothetical protein